MGPLNTSEKTQKWVNGDQELNRKAPAKSFYGSDHIDSCPSNNMHPAGLSIAMKPQRNFS